MVTQSNSLSQTHARSLLISASGFRRTDIVQRRPHNHSQSLLKSESPPPSSSSLTPFSNPRTQATCHCLDCRKVSGGAFGVSVLVLAAAFACNKGTPTNYASTSDSGNEVVNQFCGTCGVTLWADGASSPFKFVKAGVLDDAAALNRLRPAAEIYTCRRAVWCTALEGAQQKEKM
ncbi:hypothetical protein CFIO01_10334 [Colletotrichum fioriniae PJ7]|uniref:CENP-V/GFA domain-containing protein n=1 Tax=Colletotrichum fioriniae PJ7 TaxID=1445577 RepID=A0A010Q473_9PEZI|nr:hypothetical protein CFIO01_10334 [Colletotrichum fioriniae PJ7]